MSLSAFVGSFTVPNATGNKVVTGVGFQPKAILYWGNIRSADGIASGSGAVAGMPCYRGMAVSSSSRVTMGLDDNFAGGSNWLDATKCLLGKSNGTTNFAADFVSFDADGFTVNFTTANATAYLVNFLALGGADLTNAFIKSFTTPTSTGNNAQTGVGFQPDCVIAMSAETAIADSLSLGFASSTTERGATCGALGPNSYQRTNTVMVHTNASGTSVRRSADLTSFDADGFTWNWGTVNAATTTIYVLCLKGGQYTAGSFTQKAAGSGTQATTGVGFTPKALLLASARKTATTTVITSHGNAHSLGMVTSTSARAAQAFGSDAFGTETLDSTRVLKLITDDATPTVMASADLQSFDADGFTLNYSTSDGTANEVLYLAFGDAPAGGTPTDWMMAQHQNPPSKTSVVASGLMPGKGLN